MQALLRYPRHERSLIASKWAERSNAVQARQRLLRSVDFETERYRALQHRRGELLRHGATYSIAGVVTWELRRSQHGRTNQVDLLINGICRATGSIRTAQQAVRLGVWKHPGHPRHTLPTPALQD